MLWASRLSLQGVRENDHMNVPQMARFAVVGVINTAVDLAVLNTLIALEDDYFIKRKLYPNVDF
jgi:hypothetical protein